MSDTAPTASTSSSSVQTDASSSSGSQPTAESSDTMEVEVSSLGTSPEATPAASRAVLPELRGDKTPPGPRTRSRSGSISGTPKRAADHVPKAVKDSRISKIDEEEAGPSDEAASSSRKRIGDTLTAASAKKSKPLSPHEERTLQLAQETLRTYPDTQFTLQQLLAVSDLLPPNPQAMPSISTSTADPVAGLSVSQKRLTTEILDKVHAAPAAVQNAVATTLRAEKSASSAPNLSEPLRSVYIKKLGQHSVFPENVVRYEVFQDSAAVSTIISACNAAVHLDNGLVVFPDQDNVATISSFVTQTVNSAINPRTSTVASHLATRAVAGTVLRATNVLFGVFRNEKWVTIDSLEGLFVEELCNIKQLTTHLTGSLVGRDVAQRVAISVRPKIYMPDYSGVIALCFIYADIFGRSTNQELPLQDLALPNNLHFINGFAAGNDAELPAQHIRNSYDARALVLHFNEVNMQIVGALVVLCTGTARIGPNHIGRPAVVGRTFNLPVISAVVICPNLEAPVPTRPTAATFLNLARVISGSFNCPQDYVRGFLYASRIIHGAIHAEDEVVAAANIAAVAPGSRYYASDLRTGTLELPLFQPYPAVLRLMTRPPPHNDAALYVNDAAVLEGMTFDRLRHVSALAAARFSIGVSTALNAYSLTGHHLNSWFRGLGSNAAEQLNALNHYVDENPSTPLEVAASAYWSLVGEGVQRIEFPSSAEYFTNRTGTPVNQPTTTYAHWGHNTPYLVHPLALSSITNNWCEVHGYYSAGSHATLGLELQLTGNTSGVYTAHGDIPLTKGNLDDGNFHRPYGLYLINMIAQHLDEQPILHIQRRMLLPGQVSQLSACEAAGDYAVAYHNDLGLIEPGTYRSFDYLEHCQVSYVIPSASLALKWNRLVHKGKIDINVGINGLITAETPAVCQLFRKTARRLGLRTSGNTKKADSPPTPSLEPAVDAESEN